MLHPKYNRIDYGEQLIPPQGYSLVRAIGTTYCLELEALMVLPVALFYSQSLDGDPGELRYDMLDAITQAAGKITVYHHNGQLKVPHKYHHLMAYWEKGIIPVTMPHVASSFHPKVWVIRYEAKSQPAFYRVLVTSRNLTFGHEWDVAFSTEGSVSRTEQPRNRPLIHFIQYLSKIKPNTIAQDFIEDLLYIKFDAPEKFESFRFAPIGVQFPDRHRKYENPITSVKNEWNEMLIVSPFLDETTLRKLKDTVSGKLYLLSTKTELDSISEQILEGFDTWQFSRFIEDAASMEELSEDDKPSQEQSLHAKLFVAENSEGSAWFLGSANATDPAQGRNIEFIVPLVTNVGDARPRTIFKALTSPEGGSGIPLFTPYDFAGRVSVEEQKKIGLEIRSIKYALSNLVMRGSVSRVEGGTAYDLVIEIDASHMKWSDAYTITVRPLPEQNKKAIEIHPQKLSAIKDFTGYPETMLSPFLSFEISRAGIAPSRFLLSMEIDLPESRLHKIFTSIIDSREKFLKYLTFLLTGEETELIDTERGNQSGDSEALPEGQSLEGLPVFEKLLVAASRFPGKLKSVDSLIQKLKAETSEQDQPIISEDFEKFWSVFQKYMETTKQGS